MDYSLKVCLQKYKISETLIEYLGKEITTKGRAKYISEKTLNEILEFKNNHDSKEIKTLLQKYTFKKKYGVENPSQLKEVQEKRKKTNLEKYGCENPSQSNEIKQKKIETLQYHYGNGITNPMDVKEVVDKVKDNWANKSQEEIDSYTTKNKITSLKNFGVENPMMNKEISNKSKNNKIINKQNELKKYKDYYSVKESCQILNRCYDRILDVIKELNIDNINVKDSMLIHKDDLLKLEKYFNIAENKKSSNEEIDLYDFIKSIIDDEIIHNTTSVINPYELDIYIPSRNLAFEFDGIYYHSNLFKDKYYHYTKTKLCEEKGIRLIHVFEDDWRYRTNIVKSMIKSSLGIYEEKIFARKCEIKTVPLNDYKVFMNKNHLQGFANATRYLGLYHNNDLVQCIGIKNNGINHIYELNRMATKLNTQVIGGFSKLVKYAMNKYNIQEMNSYVFKAWFNGKSYETCGFKIDEESQPTYWYLINGEKVNRMNYQKKHIKEKAQKGELKYYNENESEFDNMAKNGISWIWDCGKIRLKMTR